MRQLASAPLRHMLTHTSGIGELRGPTDLFPPMIGLGAKLALLRLRDSAHALIIAYRPLVTTPSDAFLQRIT